MASVLLYSLNFNHLFLNPSSYFYYYYILDHVNPPKSHHFWKLYFHSPSYSLVTISFPSIFLTMVFLFQLSFDFTGSCNPLALKSFQKSTTFFICFLNLPRFHNPALSPFPCKVSLGLPQILCHISQEKA